MAAAPSIPMAALRPTAAPREEEAAPQPGTPPPHRPRTQTTPSPLARPLTNPRTSAHLLHPTLPPKTQDHMMRLRPGKTLQRRRHRRRILVTATLAVRLPRWEERLRLNSVGTHRRRLAGNPRRQGGGVKRMMNPGTKRERLALRTRKWEMARRGRPRDGSMCICWRKGERDSEHMVAFGDVSVGLGASGLSLLPL